MPIVEALTPAEPQNDQQRGGRPRYVSANHLLNFTLAERQVPHAVVPPHRRQSRSQRYNKERFLVANFRFLVCPGRNYEMNLADPDLMLDWSLVEQVSLSTPTPPSCPICMDYPTAPKITKCAHIFCWPCILRYLSYEQRGWRRCPLCFDAVQASDLKSVTLSTVHQYRPEETMHFVLLHREKGSTVAVRAHRRRGFRTDEALESTDPDTIYARFSTLSSVLPVLEREEQDLQRCRDASINLNDGNLPFVNDALRALHVRRSHVLVGVDADRAAAAESSTASAPAASPPPEPDEDAYLEHKAEDKDQGPPDGEQGDRDDDDDVYSDPWGTDDDADAPRLLDAAVDVATPGTTASPSPPQAGPAPPTDDVAAVPKSSSASSTTAVPGPATATASAAPATDMYYYHQAADGQNVFLHPLNVKCLLQQWGAHANFPPTLEGTILELERMTMDEALRKRHRHLSHLPLGCDFYLCELDVAPLVDAAVLAQFADELKVRWQRRMKRQRDDKRRAERDASVGERRSLSAVMAELGAIKARREHVEDLHNDAAFPPVAAAATTPSASSTAASGPPASSTPPSTSTAPVAIPTSRHSHGGTHAHGADSPHMSGSPVTPPHAASGILYAAVAADGYAARPRSLSQLVQAGAPTPCHRCLGLRRTPDASHVIRHMQQRVGFRRCSFAAATSLHPCKRASCRSRCRHPSRNRVCKEEGQAAAAPLLECHSPPRLAHSPALVMRC